METQSQSGQLEEFWKRVIATLKIEIGLSSRFYIFYTGDNKSICQKLQGTRKYFVKSNLVSKRLILQKQKNSCISEYCWAVNWFYRPG